MRKMHPRYLAFWGVALVLLHVGFSFRTGNGDWIGASGALLVILAVIAAGRPIIRKGYKAWDEGRGIIDLGSLSPGKEEIEEDYQTDIDALAVSIYGPILAGAGTLIWAYASIAWGVIYPASS